MKTIEINNYNLSIWENGKRLKNTKILYFSYLINSIKYGIKRGKTEEIILSDDDEFYHNGLLKARR